MKNVLFVAPTTYQIPLTENIEKKFKYLSEICNLHIFAFSNEKNHLKIGDTKLYLYKKVKASRWEVYFALFLQNKVAVRSTSIISL